jgi:hypothetical protein
MRAAEAMETVTPVLILIVLPASPKFAEPPNVRVTGSEFAERNVVPVPDIDPL